MKKQVFTKSYVENGTYVIGFLILLVIQLLREVPFGTEHYLNIRLAGLLSLFDPLSFGGRFAAYSWGTPLVLSPAPEFLALVLPIILGVLSIFVFRNIVKEFVEEKALVNIASIFFIFSPIYIYLFSSANTIFMPFFISLSIFYLFVKNKWKKLNYVLIAVMPLFSISFSIFLLLILGLYSFAWKKDRKKDFLRLFYVGAFVSLIYFSVIVYNTGLPNLFEINKEVNFSLFQELLFDFGSNLGVAIFTFVLAIMGFIYLWSKKYENLFVFFSVLILFVLSYFFQTALIFFNIFLIFFAALGFLSLIKRRWSSQYFRRVTLLLILIGVVFSGASQEIQIIEALPNTEIMEAVDLLSQHNEVVILSDYSRGVWINYAGHKNVIDENYLFVSDAEERYQDIENVFYLRNLEDSEEILEKYNVSYIWVDDWYRDEIWDYETEGLLFVAQYTKDFNKIYEEKGVDIWRIEG
ncbi:hypothetical protein HN681_05035 [archaeon]|jgi:hypothetical protein|nr:hypothetical protein [archaeon]MBT3731334.1 hypothetical protein [archaeon]MBT4670363.1 hypothetical protein [archaeon]MBT5030201.1 hypothetical protein [archaeon]MBT5287732.1 hypothetical protein [archaeon]